jgi:hypothetical protein
MHRESLGEQRAHKVHLAWEAVGGQSFGHGRATSDVGGGRRVEAAGREQILGGVQNPFARLTVDRNLSHAR